MPALKKHREIVDEYFKLIAMQKFQDVLQFFDPACKTHNPYISGSMVDISKGMAAANKEGRSQNPDASFTVRYILEEADMVAAYTNLLNDKAKPGAGGLRQVHLFRFEGDKIVEYWDVTQQIMPDMPNTGGAF